MLVDRLEAALALLVFVGAFSCSLHRSALQGLLIISPGLQRQPGIDQIMGLNDSLDHRSEEGCWLQNISSGDESIRVLACPCPSSALFFIVSDTSGAF